MKTECINRMIFFGTRSLQRAIDECRFFQQDRPHLGLGNELITPAPAGNADGEIIKPKRLGRLIRCYHRAA